MLLENSFFGKIDKVGEAIENLKKYEPLEGYYVAFSGGKDSVVILDLVKRAGVKFEAHHHIMTIEPPELMQFIFKQYPEVINDRPAKTMHQLIVQYGFPPLRQIRYCCRELKSSNGKNRIKVTGVRAEESPRRAKQAKVEINEHGGELRLIHDWTAADVWEYIRARNLPYCKLYDEGKKRIGCIFCPFARERENIENALKYPQFVRYFITACDRAIKTRTEQGKTHKYNSGAEMFVAWIEGGRGKKLKDFGVIFDFEKGVFIVENNEKFDTSSTAVVPSENKTSVANIPDENNNEVTNAPNSANELDVLSVEQLTLEAKFFFAQMGQNAVEFGKRLIAIKKKLPHGQWQDWLENNFHLKKSSAANFMKIAERFSNFQSIGNLGYAQMLALVSLPAGAEEKFLKEMDEKGTPFKNMTQRQANFAVKDWQAEAEKNKKEVEKLKKEAKEKDAEAEKLKKENEELRKDNELKLDVNRSNAEEYFRMKAEKEQEIADLQAKNAELEKKLEEPVVEVIPEDYEQTKEELTKLKAREENFREEVATSQALNQFFMMANFLHEHQDCLPEVLKGYVLSDPLTPQRITQIKKIVSNFEKILAKFPN